MDLNDSSDQRPLSALLADLGQQLEAYRISRNLKQAELAELAGVGRSTLVRMEAGKGGTIDSLARVMRALGLGERLLEIVPDAKLSPLDPRSETRKPRKRVRHAVRSNRGGKWAWGDEAP
jgi:transcriptional regulator with XRE-family HTH domain